MTKNSKIIAIFIAYNAQKTLKKFWQQFPKHLFDSCILVDDASQDNTFQIAQNLKGIKAYQNYQNLGYGGNLKKALKLALNQGADIIVDLHPDNEYHASAIKPALNLIKNQKADLILGNRFYSIKKLIKNGYPIYKIPPLIFLNLLSKLILNLPINDYHQGFRVYTKNLLQTIKFKQNSNNYLFSFQLLTQATFHKFKILQVPVTTNYQGQKRGASFVNSLFYFLSSFKTLAQFLLAKTGYHSSLFKTSPKKVT